jgi:hypothetical protein
MLKRLLLSGPISAVYSIGFALFRKKIFVPDFEKGLVALKLILIGSTSMLFTEPLPRKLKERPRAFLIVI